MEITQPMKQLSQTLVHHLKVRNVKASIRPPTCFQNKSCSSSRRSCCHGLTDSNIVQSFSSSRLSCKHNSSSWWHVPESTSFKSGLLFGHLRLRIIEKSAILCKSNEKLLPIYQKIGITEKLIAV